MSRCRYCLCKICTRISCPRGRWHCHYGRCFHEAVHECDFFTRRKVTRIYRIKSISPAISADQLRKLRNVINVILDDIPALEQPKAHMTLHQKIQAEEQRHKQELRRIVREAQENKKN